MLSKSNQSAYTVGIECNKKDHANMMISDGNEQGTLHKSVAKKKSTPGNCNCSDIIICKMITIIINNQYCW